MNKLFEEICKAISFHCHTLNVFETSCLQLHQFFQQKFHHEYHTLYLQKLLRRIPRKWEQLQQENGAINRLLYCTIAEVYPIRFKLLEIMNLYEEMELVWKPKLGSYYNKTFEQYSNLISYLRFLDKQTCSLPLTTSDGTKIVYKKLFGAKFIPRNSFSYSMANKMIRKLHKIIIKLSPFYIEDSILDVVNRPPNVVKSNLLLTQGQISFTSATPIQPSTANNTIDSWKEDKDLEMLKRVYEYHKTDAQLLRAKHETLRNLLSKEYVAWSSTPFETIDYKRYNLHEEHHERVRRIREQLHGYAVSHQRTPKQSFTVKNDGSK